MNRHAIEILDIALLVIILGLVLSTSAAGLYKDYREVIENNHSVMEDKNTSRNKGFYVNEYGLYDGTLSKLEVVLVSQIQDENMPSPRKIVIDGLDVDIPLTYKEFAFECGQLIWHMVKGQKRDMRYSIDYTLDKAADGSVLDEYYAINKMYREGDID